MVLVQNDQNKVKVRFNPIFIKVFLYIFLLAGMFNVYKMALGHPVDVYGTFIFFMLPLILLSFVFCKVVIEIVGKEVIVTRYYLMRKKTEKFETKTVKEFFIASGKGSSGKHSLKMIITGEEYPIVTGFAQLGKAKNGEALNALNQRLNQS